MTGPLTEEELDAMPEKTKKHAGVVELYRSHDFLTAYAKHTDLRIKENGYRAAIGSDEHGWDLHGQLQLDFLVSQGLKSGHRLLDIGCGTGRLARKAAPYCHYFGFDISEGAVEAANQLSHTEGWDVKRPVISCKWPGDVRFDFLWAFSVFIHLPQDAMVELMKRAAAVMYAESRFFFAYVPNDVTFRSGVKQFRKTLKDYQQAAASAGLAFKNIPDWSKNILGGEPRWAGHQRVALATL